MFKKHLLRAAAVMLAGAGVIVAGFRLQAAEPKYTIKEAMKQGHKAPKGVDPMSKKAADGKASREEIAKLVEFYEAMTLSKPPQGDGAGWKEKTTTLLAAAKDLQAGKDGAAAKFKAAVNCKACHSVHKPD